MVSELRQPTRNLALDCLGELTLKSLNPLLGLRVLLAQIGQALLAFSGILRR